VAADRTNWEMGGQIGWFEVVRTRGHVEDGKVAH
jgi:flavin-binding protein dodecin